LLALTHERFVCLQIAVPSARDQTLIIQTILRGATSSLISIQCSDEKGSTARQFHRA
jgi:hypothetical protein